MIALTLAFFYKLAFTDLILARGDTFAYFYPYWHARNAALMSGQLPLWSPNLFMGVPLLANSQLGTFYPPNWMVAPLSPPDGIRVSILLHVAWAGIGAYWLARRTLGVGHLAAITAAILYAFGGHVSAHVEQINQLQGLSWLPWLIYLFDRALKKPFPNAILLAMGLALQFFTGHTQTVFITGVGLAIYALCTRPLRGAITLAGAGIGALILAVPQLIPTLELMGVSNRRGGLNVNQATAFSFSPFVTGRGLLPSYDSLIFAEYVAYPGVIGLGLAVIGAISVGAHGGAPLQKRRFPLSPRATWLIIALAGLALAYGLYNPLYWLLGTLPGFNLFRVPARWLALFALGAAMLAGLGMEWIKTFHPTPNPSPTSGRGASDDPEFAPSPEIGGGRRPKVAGRGLQKANRRIYFAILLILAALAASTALTLRQNDLTPASLPTTLTLIGWAAALILLLIGVWRRIPVLLAGAAVVELWLAAWIMPYNQLVPPEAYSAQRFTISQLLAYQQDQSPEPPGRILSISGLLFDPGDRAVLEARYANLSPEALALAFDAVKMKEVLAANLPLIWGIPSVDGFDGGLLPTAYYTAFTSLFLPPDQLRTIDGRLREILARENCGGACIPDWRWLHLMDVSYLITDKNYDLVYEGVFYDTQMPGFLSWNPQNFFGDMIDVLCRTCTADLSVDLFDATLMPEDDSVAVGEYMRYRFRLPENYTSELIPIQLSEPVQAVTLVDSRTGDFQQLTDMGFGDRVLSSDIKMYGGGASRRVFLVDATQYVRDDDLGTEDTLSLMRDSAFDPTYTVIIAGEGEDIAGTRTGPHGLVPLLPRPQITEYTDTRVAMTVDSPFRTYLVLTDAYYPGWTATVNGDPVPVERADVMFRAVRVPAGQSRVTFTYRPSWLPAAPLIGGAAWLATLFMLLVTRLRRR